MFKFLFLFLLLATSLRGVEYHSLSGYLQLNPFAYDLGLVLHQGKSDDEDILLCCHGYSGDEKLASILNTYEVISDHLVGFRFPDAGHFALIRPAHLLAYGTIHELLPLLHMMKRIAVDASADRINLYGFSAGGGAIINALTVLVEQRYISELEQIGIGPKESQKILSAVQKGMIILDCPLKSLDEISAFRGPFSPLDILRERYASNNLRPIDSISGLSSLKLNVLLYFEDPDEILSNRDDALFIKRLRTANARGETHVVIGHEGGHMAYHAPLWNTYLGLTPK